MGLKLSVSALNDLTKCGYKYYLSRILGKEEPGKRSYNMLQGDIMGSAIQYCCIILNTRKTLSVDTMARVLYAMFVKYYYKAEISPCLLPLIKEILLEGLSESAMLGLDELSHAINSTRYEMAVPDRLKGGKLSANKKKLPLPMRVVKMMEDLVWFFSNEVRYHEIRTAKAIQAEKYFQLPISEPKMVTFEGINEQGVPYQYTEPDSDVVHGYLDILITLEDDTEDIYELKYTSTAYSQQFVNVMNQAVTYQLAHPTARRVFVVDVNHNQSIQANIQPDTLARILHRYHQMDLMIQHQIYIPVCGTDPYNTGKVLCGFKCGGCPYATGVIENEMEEAA